jgi:hypothetical protein
MTAEINPMDFQKDLSDIKVSIGKMQTAMNNLPLEIKIVVNAALKEHEKEMHKIKSIDWTKVIKIFVGIAALAGAAAAGYLGSGN